jgi:hypothetical protein
MPVGITARKYWMPINVLQKNSCFFVVNEKAEGKILRFSETTADLSEKEVGYNPPSNIVKARRVVAHQFA